MRITRHGKSQKMHFQEFWDSCAQNKTSEISTNALSGILGLLGAEQDVGNLKNALSGVLEILGAEQDVGNLKHALSGIMGLLRAEQDVGNLKKMRVQELWDSCARNNTSELSKK